MVSTSCESCGWAAAIVAMLCIGSFGVPIKSETCKRLDIDPLVFQSYKSVVCFMTSAIVMVATGHPFRFTPWGIVSATFWVPGGVATVAAVKLAGLALSLAVGNSLIALVSFSWGIFVFKEPVHSRWMACVAVGMMVLGFSGMSYFSTRKPTEETTKVEWIENGSEEDAKRRLLVERQLLLDTNSIPLLTSRLATPSPVPQTCPSTEEDSIGDSIELVEEARLIQTINKEVHDFSSKTFSSGTKQMVDGEQEGGGLRHRLVQHQVHHHTNEMVCSPKQVAVSSIPDALPSMPTEPLIEWFPQSQSQPRPNDNLLRLRNTTLSRRQVGIALAVFNGCYGGSIMAPLKLCPDPTITSGVGYVWSFSVGAMIVTLALWFFRYLWILTDTGSPKDAYQALPSFHLKAMWKLGGLSGLVWSTGNIFSILAVDFLGEGVGYCVCQASMLVSGLWGIFYFREVTGVNTIFKWFLSAFLTVSGILLLSYEHHEA